ncbi:MAG: metal-dependent transcriptional regulator [Chitinivibrionales bacterium]|nr:metal-dependent transcriptional regulator [Chitinivibrionales bacterium]
MGTLTLTSTLEDYLEVIFRIISTNKVARAMEIAEQMQVKRSSVTVALRSLAGKGYINYSPRSYVTLTSKGEKVAQCVNKRHLILNEVFTKVLGLSDRESENAACKMEHGMTSQVCRKLAGMLNALADNKELSQELVSNTSAQARLIDCENSCGYAVTSSDSSVPLADNGH